MPAEQSASEHVTGIRAPKRAGSVSARTLLHGTISGSMMRGMSIFSRSQGFHPVCLGSQSIMTSELLSSVTKAFLPL